jgi:hypothetical protein
MCHSAFVLYLWHLPSQPHCRVLYRHMLLIPLMLELIERQGQTTH